MRSSAGVGQEEEEEESGDEEEEGEKDTFPSWKKTIMIGPSYQASVPSGTTNYDDRFAKQSVFFSAGIINLTLCISVIYYIYQMFKRYIFSPPYENEDKQLWDPTRLAEEVKTVKIHQNLRGYLRVQSRMKNNSNRTYKIHINHNIYHLQVSREYLAKAAETLPGSTPCGVNGIPVGKHVRLHQFK